MTRICLLLLLAFVLLALISTAQTQSPPAYKNPNLPIEVRVNDLVSRMTLDEKISQMMKWTIKAQPLAR